MRLLAAGGYRLAYDPMYADSSWGGRKQVGFWWLTKGRGKIFSVAPSVAERLVHQGRVRESLKTEDIVYYEWVK